MRGLADDSDGTKYLWLFSDEQRREDYADSFAALQTLNLEIARPASGARFGV